MTSVTQPAVEQADREARYRTLLGYAAGYSISRVDAAQNCSVLAKYAVSTALKFSDEEVAASQSELNGEHALPQLDESDEASLQWSDVLEQLEEITDLSE